MQGMEKGVKEFAQNVEQLVDRVVSGDLALKLTQDADKMVSGFIRHFEVSPMFLTSYVVYNLQSGGPGKGGGIYMYICIYIDLHSICLHI